MSSQRELTGARNSAGAARTNYMNKSRVAAFTTVMLAITTAVYSVALADVGVGPRWMVNADKVYDVGDAEIVLPTPGSSWRCTAGPVKHSGDEESLTLDCSRGKTSLRTAVYCKTTTKTSQTSGFGVIQEGEPTLSFAFGCAPRK